MRHKLGSDTVFEHANRFDCSMNFTSEHVQHVADANGARWFAGQAVNLDVTGLAGAGAGLFCESCPR